MNKISVLILLVFFMISCNKPNGKLTVNDIKFQSIFGTYKKEPQKVYCLLGTGFFRAKHAENSDQFNPKMDF